MTEPARARATLEQVEPILTRLNNALNDEPYEHVVIASLMLFILIQKPDIDADTLQRVMDDISKHLQMLLLPPTPSIPSTQVN